MLPKAIAFDLDDTLTMSKAPLGAEMSFLLCELLQRTRVIVISGASFEQFRTQFLSYLLCNSSDVLKNLFLLPTDGGALYTYDQQKGWQALYTKAFNEQEKKQIMDAFTQVLADPSLTIPKETFGPQLEDRGAQITFSALGQRAPIGEKKKWDPDQTKRIAMQKKLQALLPSFSVKIGGTTSLDITREGIDKAFGVGECLKYMNVPVEEAVYVGDALYAGGNDTPVQKLGIRTIQVADSEETRMMIAHWLEGREDPIGPHIVSEVRPWGEFRRFTCNEPSTVKIITVKAGEAFSLQDHHKRTEFWRILSGSAHVTVGEGVREAHPGEEFLIPVGTKHRLEAIETTEFLEISLGDFRESDIERFEDKYGRVKGANSIIL